MILIISDAIDIQIPSVTYYLKQWGSSYVQLNVADFPQKVIHTSNWGSDGYGQHLTLPTIAAIDCSDIRAVWYRKPVEPQICNDIAPTQKEYAFDESRNDLEGLYSYLSDRFWISWIDCIRRANNKPLQLRIASDMGFTVPDTIITNSPTVAEQFYRKHDGHIVYKTISGGVLYSRANRWGDRRVSGEIYTTPLEEHTELDFNGVALCPCMFQEYISKSFEIRVTVVLDKVFAVEIHSQMKQETQHDWRRKELVDVPHKVHDLPADISSLCCDLVRRLGLRYGAIDMIYTPDHKYVFLEINPNGQFGWLEEETGLHISESIAAALFSADSGVRPDIGPR